MTEQGPHASVGAHLRALREARQGSLDELARTTRISRYQLEALESDRFADLPAPVFVKGFIRAYCEALGEPAGDALQRYSGLLGERPAPERPAATRRPALVWSSSPVFISVALLVVFGAGLLAVNAAFKRGARVVERAPVPTAQTEPAPPAPVPMAQTEPPPSAPLVAAPPTTAEAAGSATPQRLLVRAIEPTWIRIQTDDLHAVQELLPPGATREWTAERRFLITVGNAGGIEVELNGRPIPRLGASGMVIRQLELPLAAAAGS